MLGRLLLVVVVPEVVQDVSVDFEVVPFVGLVLLLGSEETEGALGVEVGGDEGAADHVVEELFLDLEDGGGGVAEGDDEVEDVSGVVVGDCLLQVDLVGVEFFDIISGVPIFLDYPFNNLTRFINPTDI